MKIIIFGSGYHGRLAMRKMEYYKLKKNSISFIDNSKGKHNQKCLGKKIFQKDQLKKDLLKIAPEILKFSQPVWKKLDEFKSKKKKNII